MSQVAAKKKLAIRNEQVHVLAHFREQGSVLRGDAQGRCEAFEIELALDSDEPPEAVAELIRLSHRMCFTEDALTGHVKLTQRHRLNGRPFPED